jgi:uncharacterized membrane protein YjgN (DUF898 family)
MADTRIAGSASGPAATTAVAVAERTIRPEFTGTAGEYFRIWIVNLFFSLVTLGIYSAWAKVRKKKYFYGSTRLDGDSFDYFGRPKAILKGRIVAFVAFVVYVFAGELHPESRYVFWALAVLAMPWLVVRSLTFNARNSAYRGVRFHFNGTAKEAAGVYIGTLALAVVTAGLAYPLFAKRQKVFVASSHAFGLSRFDCKLSAGSFFWVYFCAGLITAVLFVPVIVLIGFEMRRLAQLPESLSWLSWVLPVVATYASYAVSYAYLQARTSNLLWNGTTGPGFRFSSSLAASKLLWIYAGNIVAVACTAGLLIPWAVIRTLKYRLDNLAVAVEEGIVHEANPAFARVGATGQELGDFFNLDLGL